MLCWDPRLPSIPSITNKHWRTMITQDSHLQKVFPEPPLIVYKRQKNIGDKIIRAKVFSNKSIRDTYGMHKCNENKCKSCEYIIEGQTIHIKNITWNIIKNVNCQSANVVYIIFCKKENCE